MSRETAGRKKRGNEGPRRSRTDDRVSRFAKMKGSFVSVFGPERTADNSRRIGLRYAQILKGRVSDVLVHAVVDLSARKLAHFEETSAEAGLRR